LAAILLFRLALFAADRVHRPGVLGVRFQPAIGKQIVQVGTRHGLALGGLRERFAASATWQLLENVTQPSERLDSIRLGAADQRIERRRVVAAALAADEQKILSPDRRVLGTENGTGRKMGRG
jgi:hypothetical protein